MNSWVFRIFFVLAASFVASSPRVLAQDSNPSLEETVVLLSTQPIEAFFPGSLDGSGDDPLPEEQISQFNFVFEALTQELVADPGDAKEIRAWWKQHGKLFLKRSTMRTYRGLTMRYFFTEIVATQSAKKYKDEQSWTNYIVYTIGGGAAFWLWSKIQQSVVSGPFSDLMRAALEPIFGPVRIKVQKLANVWLAGPSNWLKAKLIGAQGVEEFAGALAEKSEVIISDFKRIDWSASPKDLERTLNEMERGWIEIDQKWKNTHEGFIQDGRKMAIEADGFLVEKFFTNTIYIDSAIMAAQALLNDARKSIGLQLATPDQVNQAILPKSVFLEIDTLITEQDNLFAMEKSGEKPKTIEEARKALKTKREALEQRLDQPEFVATALELSEKIFQQKSAIGAVLGEWFIIKMIYPEYYETTESGHYARRWLEASIKHFGEAYWVQHYLPQLESFFKDMNIVMNIKLRSLGVQADKADQVTRSKPKAGVDPRDLLTTDLKKIGMNAKKASEFVQKLGGKHKLILLSDYEIRSVAKQVAPQAQLGCIISELGL